MTKRTPYDFADAPAGAPVVWKSLEALDAPELAEARKTQELPERVDVGTESLLGRRTFLTLASATAAAVGLEGCIRRPAEKILPYSRAPEHLVPGVPMHFATVTNDGGDALGLLVTTHEGRPTKIEGNALHPTSRGATTLEAQASLLDLYDPDRSMSPTHRPTARTSEVSGAREAATFAQLDELLQEKLTALGTTGGRGLRILAAPTNSLSFLRMRAKVMQRFPEARFHTWTPVSDTNVREGARIAFGVPLHCVPQLERARTVLSVDCDFLQTEPGSVRAARGFMARRRLGTGPVLATGADADAGGARFEMNRLYVVESTFSTTGANADNRLRLASRDAERFLRLIAAELVRLGTDLGSVGASLGEVSRDGIPARWVTEVARELKAAGREAVVLVGSRQPAAVHALAHAIHAALGCVGTTVRHTPVVDRDQPGDLAADVMTLASDIEANAVNTLIILGGNPVYDAPADARFGERLRRVETSIHLSNREDETSTLCTWHVPLAHELETWGDQRSTDGTISVQQPMIAPLRGGRSEIEMLGIVGGETNWRGHEVVRATLRAALAASTSFERDWRRSLRDGVVPGTTVGGSMQLVPDLGRISSALSRPAGARNALGTDNLELVFAPCPKLRDGRHANNAWLQELPDPITRISWDNAALMSPQTAADLHLRMGDRVRITRDGKNVELGVFVLPGHADNSITLNLGWGRKKSGRHGDEQGTDVYPLRASTGLGFVEGAHVSKVGTHPIVQTQDHWDMEGRAIAVDATVEEYQNGPTFPSYRSIELRQRPLWPEAEYRGYKWGLSIDLTACTGCNACVIACQSENNIPVVGKDMVRRGREMHWIRIDRYFLNAPTKGAANRAEEVSRPTDVHDPVIAFQPVACQQCEEAPCENVCPVNATTHSPEGLNDMAYNRCIGTRYCANNCPYKVRRFNYLAYQAPFENVVEEKRMQFNPNVTVRGRGVMEKCTYCVQRIQSAKIHSRNEGRFIRDGEITPACAQSCPTQAIVFGDLNQPKSRVAKLAETDRRYMLLAEIGTQPRTFYLAKIRNPNRELLA